MVGPGLWQVRPLFVVRPLSVVPSTVTVGRPSTVRLSVRSSLVGLLRSSMFVASFHGSTVLFGAAFYLPQTILNYILFK